MMHTMLKQKNRPATYADIEALPPNMVGQISTCLANANLNIADLLNKSRGDMAYTLVDVESPVSPAVLADIRAIDGVLSVRYLPHPGAP